MSLKNKQKLILLVLLISVNFFNPFGVIGFTLSKVLFSAICIFCLVTCKFFSVKDKSNQMIKGQVMILIGMIIAYVVCSAYNGQPFLVSFKACLHFILAYSFLFVLIGYGVDNDRVIKLVKVMCILSMIVYVVNFISFPLVVFGTEQEEYDTSRGLVRLGMPCVELIVLLFLYYINQYQIRSKRRYLYFILLCLAFIVLSLTRQIIVYSVILGAVLYFKSVPLWKKVIFAVLCYVAVIYVIPNLGLFQSMQELTNEQFERNNDGYENIRLIAWRWFTNDLQTNDITRFFGNGYPVIDGSSWANSVLQSSKMMLCYPTDVGWAAFYFYYGVLTTFFLAFVLLKAVLMKKTEEGSYLTYWILMVILSSFTSGMILYPNQIISITLALYLVYIDNKKAKGQLIKKV